MLSFDSIVFGPIHSRRLGCSLGINLLPLSGKLCNFDCVYCECGWNADSRGNGRMPSFQQVAEALQTSFSKLHSEGIKVDSITFSGNGEPTVHPDFAQIIDLTLSLRDQYLPSAKLSVLSNATMLGDGKVAAALKRIDNPILKLDAPGDELARAVNGPVGHYRVKEVVEAMRGFEGNFILQTMFMHGCALDYSTDNDALASWMDIVRSLRPRQIMVYTIDRDTPDKSLRKMSAEQMRKLLTPLIEEGFNVQING